MTSEGGGAVAFPVMTLGKQIWNVVSHKNNILNLKISLQNKIF